MVVTRDWTEGNGKGGKLLFKGQRGSLWEDEKSLDMDGGVGWMTT